MFDGGEALFDDTFLDNETQVRHSVHDTPSIPSPAPHFQCVKEKYLDYQISRDAFWWLLQYFNFFHRSPYAFPRRLCIRNQRSQINDGLVNLTIWAGINSVMSSQAHYITVITIGLIINHLTMCQVVNYQTYLHYLHLARVRIARAIIVGVFIFLSL